MEKTSDLQTRNESTAQLVEHINLCLRSGDYSRALDLLRGAAAEFPDDAELAELEKRAHDGIKRKAETDRLITESQELFAQRKPAEAIQFLRKAYELDKNNALSRAILANALVEHAQSLVESDWLKAETLTNQALSLNPAHPTAKTILRLIVDKKETSSVEDWVSQASKLQSSGDLFAALAWVAEGLAVHPNDPKLLLVQDAIQRDQDTRRRQARRGDLDEMRHLQHEIDEAADVPAKQALAERIQAVAAKYWTDGEILSIANALLLRLGLVPQESSGASPRGKSGTVILHVPRPSAPKPSPADISETPPSKVTPREVQTKPVPTSIPPTPALPAQVPEHKVPPDSALPGPSSLPAPVPQGKVAPSPVLPGSVLASPVLPGSVVASPPAAKPVQPSPIPPNVAAASPSGKVPLRTPPHSRLRTAPPPAQLAPPPATVPAAEPIVTAAKFAPPSSEPKPPAKSSSATLIFISISTAVAAIILAVAATFFLTRKHYAPPVAQTPAAAPAIAIPVTPAPAVSAPARTTSEPALPAAPPSTDAGAGEVAPADQAPAESARDLGMLVVAAGQDGASVFLNGKLQRQVTVGGQLRLPNLEAREYLVQVSKSGFQDPPLQRTRIRAGEQARLVFNLQPKSQPQPLPRLASLTIQGGIPGTAVLVDQTPVGTIQPDGTLSVSNINPGDHTVELRKDRFKPRQLRKQFIEGGTIAFAAADATLEAAPGELTIAFTPADAKVAIVKGDLLKIVSSGVPLNLAPGTYTLTARTAERFTRSSTFEVVAGQSKTLDLSLAPNGMSKWEDAVGWKQEKDSFIHKGGEFVLYGVAPAAGTFIFSAMPAKGHVLEWVLNYTDARNYVLLQMDDASFYRTVVRNGQKTDEIRVPDKEDKKSFRTIQIRVSPTEIVHLVQHGVSWTVLDRWTQPGANLSQGKFGFYIPGNDEVALSSFSHYADLNLH